MAATEIQVKCTAGSGDLATKIRTLFCREAAATPTAADRNPLVVTNFNDLLDGIVQEAFDEGRKFQREHPKL